MTFEFLNSRAVADIVSAIVWREQFGDIVLKTGKISGKAKCAYTFHVYTKISQGIRGDNHITSNFRQFCLQFDTTAFIIQIYKELAELAAVVENNQLPHYPSSL